MFFADPEILEHFGEDSRSTRKAACRSPNITRRSRRPAKVRVRFLDRDNQRREIEAEGLLATCIQHEIDHLDGKLFIDHLSRLKRERAIKKFTKAARLSEPTASPESRKARKSAKSRAEFMRVIFMGTPDFALAPLAEIFGRGHEIVAVYTRAPKPAGRRGLELTPSPVHAAAERYGLKVLTPKNFRDPETVQEFSAP